MTIFKVLSAAVVGFSLAGCADGQWGEILRNTATGVAEGACRSASNCSAGMRRDALAPKPAWDKGGASPKDNPFPSSQWDRARRSE